MDVLSEVLANLRSSGALVGKDLLRAPWSIEHRAPAALTLVSLLRGTGWILPEGGSPIEIGPRDVAVLSGDRTTILTSDASGRTAAGCLLGDDGMSPLAAVPGRAHLRTLDSDEAAGVLQDHFALLTATFPVSGRIADRLLGSLPPVVVVPVERQRSRALEMLEEELEEREPGRQAVLDRLLDIVLIRTLRDWFALEEVEAPAWYGASADPVVGPALAALHADPAAPWTVGSLARVAQVSRATLARRFAETMGEPPISYLSGWRLCQAADLLQDGDGTVDAVARQVGYSSAFALSAAFTREYGMRPSRYRVEARSGSS
ncbi:AraC family transcriptional regulator [Brachybacterium ginsengisoli]|uniref:AraC family transcriptional regulator n=1 Tax=Brachybacterium ginsengisoli TaxID=1331682 RepID=A0A291H0F5_9MICO|nr:AraC family transcriptional regulator [Brachybacterium ginsengisoli]ATG55935.1 AraC family transcriptional regulator [Brachybacterium ginsengisoli]